MCVHTLKIFPEFFTAVVSGVKTFEIRFNDRDFKCGDVLHLQEWDVDSGYSGRSVAASISYVLENVPGLCVGYVILGLSNVVEIL